MNTTISRLALIVLTAMSIIAPPAVAHADWRVDRAVAIGVFIFHPACQPTVEFDPVPAEELDAQGWIQDDGSCVVHLVEQRWPWPVLCETVVHEIGHLAGAGHSTNLNSVMYPSVQALFSEHKWFNVIPRCQHRGRETAKARRLP